MAQDPLEIWKRNVPLATEIALKDLAFAATAEAHDLCKAEYPNYIINYIAGQHRFTKMQYKMLHFGATDPALSSKPLFHINGLPFTQLYNSALHITSATVESARAYPQISLLREAEQVEQLRFLNFEGALVGHLCVCVEGDLRVPSIVQIHFPDGKGGYLEQYVDLTHLKHAAPILPVESVTENRPRERRRETDINRSDT